MRTYFAFSVKPVHCPLTATIAVERTRMWKPIIFEWLRRCGLNGTSDIYTVGLQFQIWFVVSSFIHSLISSSDYGMCGMKRRVHPDSSSSNIVCTASASSVHGHCISCSELGLACILTGCAHTTAWTLHSADIQLRVMNMKQRKFTSKFSKTIWSMLLVCEFKPAGAGPDSEEKAQPPG